MHFLILRLAPDAQKETRAFAREIFDILRLFAPTCARYVLATVWFNHPTFNPARQWGEEERADELRVLRAAVHYYHLSKADKWREINDTQSKVEGA